MHDCLPCKSNSVTAVASPEDSLAQTQDKQQNLAAPTSETDAREKTQAAAADQSDFRMSMEEHESTVSQAHGDSFADKATADTTTSAGQPVRDSGYRVAVPDSPDFSPEPAGDLSSNVAGEQHVPATISDVPRSRAETQEIEGPVVSEVQAISARWLSITDLLIARTRRCPKAQLDLRTLREPPSLLPCL